MNTDIKLALAVSSLVLLTGLSAHARSSRETHRDPAPSKVYKTSESITIDGKADEACWETAQELSLEHYYLTEKLSDKQKTSLKLLWDEKHIYAFFECRDRYINARETERDGEPYFDDCAELFFIPTADVIQMHFGFEINLLHVANDFVFMNKLFRDKGVAVTGYNPVYQVATQIKGTMNDNSDNDRGWTMEIAIPLAELSTSRVIPAVKEGSSWLFMSVRKDRNESEGKRAAMATLFPLKEDKGMAVHEPDSFGTLIFSAEAK